jgi:hypothetical protein
MIALWMLHSLLVATLLGAAAWGLEGALRAYGLPLRWVWGAGLSALLLLAALAPLRARPPAPSGPASLPAAVVVEAEAATGSPGGGVAAELARLRGALRGGVDAPLRRIGAFVGQPAWAGADRALAGLWLGSGALLLLLFAGTHLHYRGARRGWPGTRLHGVPVRIAPAAGPAVTGLLRPEIVVPRWLLDAGPDQQRMGVAHEREHVRGRDPWLLGLGCLAVAALPWNPAAWWMLARLRLAVELDCDARVLRQGVGSRTYGMLLLDIAGRSTGLQIGAPALADTPSHLERRLIAMDPKHSRFRWMRAGALGLVAVAAGLTACESRMPTAAQVEAMDVAAVQEHAATFHLVGDTTNTVFLVDGQTVTAAAARTLRPDEIARIEIHRRTGEGTDGRVSITTRAAAAAAGEDLPPVASGERPVRFLVRGDSGSVRAGAEGTPVTGERIVIRRSGEGPGAEGEVRTLVPLDDDRAMIFIDGARANAAAMRALQPGDIEKIEVLKGEEARKLYSEPGAASGVIRITTRRGAGPR